MERLGDLYFELSNEDRLKILYKLQETPMNVTKISRELDITTQECSRHITRLSTAMLVERSPDGEYYLSQYGRLSIRLIAGQRFVSDHREYFLNHTLEKLPLEFVSRVGELQGGKLTDNVMLFFNLIEDLIKESQEYFWFVHDQYLPSILPLGAEAMRRGVTSKSVELKTKAPGRNLNSIRPEYIDLADENLFIKLWHDGKIVPHFSDEVHIFLYVSEKEALIAFPLTIGGFDYIGFSGRDPTFHKYCSDLFNYYFSSAVPPDPTTIDEKIHSRLSKHKKTSKD
jgi:predicted transcriptional regulator